MSHIEVILLATIFGYLGAYVQSRRASNSNSARGFDLRSQAYTALLGALIDFERATTVAERSEVECGSVSDELKVAVSDAGTALLRLASTVGFVLAPSSVHMIEGAVAATNGLKWEDRLEGIRDVRQRFFTIARTDGNTVG